MLALCHALKSSNFMHFAKANEHSQLFNQATAEYSAHNHFD